MEQSSIIALSVKKYEELKKSKFSDKQIRKIAQPMKVFGLKVQTCPTTLGSLYMLADNFP